MIGFSGRWCGEFRTNRIPWTPGIHMRESRTGRRGPERVPGRHVPGTGTANTRSAHHAYRCG